MTLEETQEMNLANNWLDRKASATLVAQDGSLRVMEWDRRDGARVFYVVRGDVPLAYVIGYDISLGDVFDDTGLKHFQIQSTFVTRNARKQGVGTFLYTHVIRRVGVLASDKERSVSADALWSSLMR